MKFKYLRLVLQSKNESIEYYKNIINNMCVYRKIATQL